MWMPPQTTTPPLQVALKRRGDQRSHRGEDDGRVQFCRGELLGAAGPDGPQAAGEFLGLGVAGAGEAVDLEAVVDGHLDGDVGRGPETVNPQALDARRRPGGRSGSR